MPPSPASGPLPGPLAPWGEEGGQPAAWGREVGGRRTESVRAAGFPSAIKVYRCHGQ